MNTASPGINQAYIDAKTFSVGDGEYEDKYSVIEKINRAFSQTLLQYMNSWYYFRPEELYMPVANNLRQFNYNPLVLPPSDWTSSSVRFDINIGKTQTVKPIAPQMLRFIKRPTKLDQINFNYDYPSEVFPNQNFQRGNLITSTSTYKTYTINNWFYTVGVFSSSGLRMYINGSLVQSNGTAFSPSYGVGSFFVGGFSATQELFQGRIANVSVYNRDLSATEVLQNFNAQKARFGL
jgi:hypothetical protein